MFLEDRKRVCLFCNKAMGISLIRQDSKIIFLGCIHSCLHFGGRGKRTLVFLRTFLNNCKVLYLKQGRNVHIKTKTKPQCDNMNNLSLAFT